MNVFLCSSAPLQSLGRSCFYMWESASLATAPGPVQLWAAEATRRVSQHSSGGARTMCSAVWGRGNSPAPAPGPFEKAAHDTHLPNC